MLGGEIGACIALWNYLLQLTATDEVGVLIFLRSFCSCPVKIVLLKNLCSLRY